MDAASIREIILTEKAFILEDDTVKDQAFYNNTHNNTHTIGRIKFKQGLYESLLGDNFFDIRTN
ncbi:MAG: hypothetical protein M3P08_20310 [Thermoproteota archaeon]|nr:hypothetical protein [Thermoproteota archaeon]